MSKTYTEEYRLEALKYVEEIGRGETAKKLGISLGTLDTWRQKARAEKTETENIEKQGSRTEIRELQEKIKEMEKEMSRIKKENEFLEEAASFFAASRQKTRQS